MDSEPLVTSSTRHSVDSFQIAATAARGQQSSTDQSSRSWRPYIRDCYARPVERTGGLHTLNGPTIIAKATSDCSVRLSILIRTFSANLSPCVERHYGWG